MPRYDDDERDDYDDRPRRRSSGGGNSTWIVLGVVGGTILLIVVGCVGLIGFGVYKAGQAVTQVTQQMGGMVAAEAWCEDLKAGRTANAYNATSKNFQANRSRAQFDQFLVEHPELTQHKHRSMVSFSMVGQAPNQQVVVKFRLHAQAPAGFAGPDADPDDDQPQTKTPPTKKKGTTVPTKKGADQKGQALQDLDITLTMVDEGGVWKVDQITIP
jgi:hypothetical protein